MSHGEIEFKRILAGASDGIPFDDTISDVDDLIPEAENQDDSQPRTMPPESEED